MISARSNVLLSRLKVVFTLQNFNHSLAKAGAQARSCTDKKFSQWRTLDSRTLGISSSMISEPSWIVLKILQSKGYEAYLVGGCVRDLILNRTPKDFDVITTAALTEVRKQFHRAEIVGQRFPICIVHIKGSVIEVSSFATVAHHAIEKEKNLEFQMPGGCDKYDLIRWRNCLHRDFTVNSLFFNPFVNKIYDYANGMKDLDSLKLRTVMPAHESFTEDSARMLRGLRIAARLGFSFSKETETAIHKLSSSVMHISKSRIMLELNYMLSYGAAEPSLCLLQRYHLLEILLPRHAAYLAHQSSESGQNSVMMMKLFSNLDRLISCDRPSNSSLWVGLLAFHLALLGNPQDPLVVLVFASVLYYGNWEKGVHFARQHAESLTSFKPEILEAKEFKSDDELAEKVAQLALLVKDAMDVMINSDKLHETMGRFPGFPCSDLVFVPRKMKSVIVNFFGWIAHFVKSDRKARKIFKINYNLLAEGNIQETRFVIGKIIMDTMGCRVDQRVENMSAYDPEQKVELFEEYIQTPPNMGNHYIMAKDDKKRTVSPCNYELWEKIAKKQKLNGKINFPEHKIAKKQVAIANDKLEDVAEREHGLVDSKKSQEVAKKHQKVTTRENVNTLHDYVAKKQEKAAVHQSSLGKIIMMQENVLKKEECQLRQLQRNKEKQKVAEIEENHKMDGKLRVISQVKCQISLNEVEQQKLVENSHFEEDKMKNTQLVISSGLHGSREKNGEHEQQLIKDKGNRLPLSTLFK